MWQLSLVLTVTIVLLSSPQEVQAQRRRRTQEETYAKAQGSVERPPKDDEQQQLLQLRNETIAFEDFEAGNDHSWSNERVSKSTLFSTFLGRFGQEDDGSNAFTTTSKTYNVPETAEYIGIEFDFFEIDLWCECDNFTVMICGQNIE